MFLSDGCTAVAISSFLKNDPKDQEKHHATGDQNPTPSLDCKSPFHFWCILFLFSCTTFFLFNCLLRSVKIIAQSVACQRKGIRLCAEAASTDLYAPWFAGKFLDQRAWADRQSTRGKNVTKYGASRAPYVLWKSFPVAISGWIEYESLSRVDERGQVRMKSVGCGGARSKGFLHHKTSAQCGTGVRR